MGRSGLLGGTALQAVALLAFTNPAAAQPAPTARPTGGQVVAGQASISQSTAKTNVDQSSQRAAIDWKSFDVGSQHTVQFNQPNANAVTLNRVTGPDPSQIAGQIIANGNIIITNASGVTFHQGAQVNANSLIVSAPGITNQNLMAGRLVFDQAPKPGARVSNAGTITVKQAGLAALVAPQVANSGTINAKLGRVVLAGAEAHTIDLYGDGLVSIDVTKQVRTAPVGPDGKPVTALVTNTGTVMADGGSVVITAKAADGIVQTLISAGGTIQANSVGDRSGRIAIGGVGGSVRIEGTVLANGDTGARGGDVAISASHDVVVAPTARIGANGRSGGGTVALGTTVARARAGATAARTPGAATVGTPAGTARNVVVATGAIVSADGLGSGSGGTVTVLSKHASTVDGLLTARGGPAGGDGGVVEASSDGVLALNTAPNLGAPAGTGGTLYLDPYDFVVGTGTPTVGLTNPNGSNPNIPQDNSTSGTSYISPATLQTAAQTATTITLNATHDLTIAEAVNLAQGRVSSGGVGGPTLVLQAGNNLSVNANLTLGYRDPTGAVSTLQMLAGGTLTVGPAATISTYGAITANAGADIVLGTGAQLVTSGTRVNLIAGSTLPSSVIGGTTAAALPTGSVRFGSNASITGDNYIDVETGSSGTITQAAGSVLDVPITFGTLSLVSGTGGTSLGGTLSTNVTGGQIFLGSSGSITQGTNGVIATTNLTGYGTTITLDNPANRIAGVVAGFRSSLQAYTGDIVIVSSTPVLVGTTSGSPGGGIQVPSGRTITLQTDSLKIGAGSVSLPNESSVAASIYAPGGTLAITPLTSTKPVELVTGTASATALSISRSDLSNVAAATLTLGASTAGPVTVGSPNVALNMTSLGGGQGFTTLNLISSDAITQVAGSSLIVPTLSANGTTVSFSNSGNQIGALAGSSASTGNVVLTDAVPLTITGPVSAATGQIDLQTDNLAFGASGSLSAPIVLLFPLTATRPIGLVGTPNESQLSITQSMLNRISTNSLVVGVGGDTGGITAGNTGDAITVSSPNLTLTNSGAITQGGGASLTVANLILTGGGGTFAPPSAVTLNGGNGIGTVRGDATGDIALRNASALTVTSLASTNGSVNVTTSAGDLTVASVSGQNIGLTSSGDLNFAAGTVAAVSTLRVNASGNINQQAGTLAASSITGGSGGSAILDQTGNQISLLNNFSTIGSFSLTDAHSLNVAGFVSVGGGQSLRLRSDAISFGQGGSLYAPLGLVTLAPVSTGTVFAVSTAVSTVVTASTLHIGSANAGNVTFTGSYNLSAINTLELQSGAAVQEDANSSITVGRLTGTADSASLLGNNAIGTVGGFGTNTGFTLNNPQALTISGPVTDNSAIAITASGVLTTTGTISAPLVTLSSGSIAQTGGTINAATQLALQATTGISQTGGGITTALLRGDAGTGPANFGGTNAITTLGPFASKTGFSLSNGASLGVAGLVSDNMQISLNVTGALALNGTLNAPKLNLTATGDVTQQSGGLIGITLTGAAINVALGSTSNQIGTLGAYQAAGNFALSDASALTVGGAVSVGTGKTLSLASNQITFGAGGSLTAPAGTVALAPLTSGTPFALSSFAPTGTVAATTLRIGSLTTGDITVSGSYDFSSVSTLDLRSAGAIHQDAASSIQVGTLTGQANTARLIGLNRIGTLGTFTTTGDFTLSDGRPLTIGGAVSVGGGRTLTLSADQIGVAPGGSLTATGGIVALAPLTPTADFNLGGFTQPGQASTATLQVGTATTGNITITGTNDFSNVTQLALRSAGVVSETSGASVTVPTLTLQANSASLGGANAITTLGSVTTNAGLSLNDTVQLIVAGPVTDPTSIALSAANGLNLRGTLSAPTVSLISSNGSIAQTGGLLTIGTLSGSAIGSADFGNAGTANVASLGAFTVSQGAIVRPAMAGPVTAQPAANSLSLTNGMKLSVVGPLSGGMVNLSAPDSLSLLNGSITADVVTLTVRAPTSPSGNAVGALSQIGTTSVQPYSLSTGRLVLMLPASGAVSLEMLNAPAMALSLGLGRGSATGSLAVSSLSLSGSGGAAALIGTVSGQSGPSAAAISTITPAIDVAYQLNGCTIGAATCGPAMMMNGNPTVSPPLPPLLPTTDSDVAILVPKSFLDTTLGSLLKTNLFTIDLITIGIVRDPSDPELLLPNVSDRDY